RCCGAERTACSRPRPRCGSRTDASWKGRVPGCSPTASAHHARSREGLMIAVAVAMLSALVWVLAPPPAHSPVPAPPRSSRREEAGPLEMAHLVEQLATVLSSGAGPRQAWAALGRSLPAGELRELARTAAAGGDLRRTASARLQRTDMVASLSTA